MTPWSETVDQSETVLSTVVAVKRNSEQLLFLAGMFLQPLKPGNERETNGWWQTSSTALQRETTEEISTEPKPRVTSSFLLDPILLPKTARPVSWAVSFYSVLSPPASLCHSHGDGANELLQWLAVSLSLVWPMDMISWLTEPGLFINVPSCLFAYNKYHKTIFCIAIDEDSIVDIYSKYYLSFWVQAEPQRPLAVKLHTCNSARRSRHLGELFL